MLFLYCITSILYSLAFSASLESALQSESAGKVGKVGRIIEAIEQSGLGDAAGRLYERIKKIDEEDRAAGISR